ncbi:MAG TPA: hypothetical protein VGD37_12320 [Kofleriaceae bacterium]|jgi:hypothetical protein
MNDVREQQLVAVRAIIDGRPVRWSSPQPGDYDGRDRTLEVFNADAGEQRDLIRRLRAVRTELENAAGGPVVIVFHTRKESARLYADYIEQALRSEIARDVAAAESTPFEDSPPLATDVGLRPGARSLPRRVA